MKFLNDEPCMVKPTLIEMNLVKLKFYPFMISLNRCTRISSVLSRKMYVPKERKYINVKAFNLITKKNEVKAMTKHISCACKCKFNSRICNSNQKWSNKRSQCGCKSYRKCRKSYSWNPSTCICENVSI